MLTLNHVGQPGRSGRDLSDGRDPSCQVRAGGSVGGRLAPQSECVKRGRTLTGTVTSPALGRWLAPRIWASAGRCQDQQREVTAPGEESLSTGGLRQEERARGREEGWRGRVGGGGEDGGRDLSPWPLESSVLSANITKCVVRLDFLSKPVTWPCGRKRWAPTRIWETPTFPTARLVWHDVVTLNLANSSSVYIGFIYCSCISKGRKGPIRDLSLCVSTRNLRVS